MGTHSSEGCFFRRCKTCETLIKGDCPGILDATEHKGYTFQFGGGHLRLYRGRGDTKDKEPLLSWDDTHPLKNLKYLATATGVASSGESHWILHSCPKHR